MVNLHPVVLRADIPSVAVDCASKTRVAFEYLAGLGYRHMASFGNSAGGYVDEPAAELAALAEARGFSHSTGSMVYPVSGYEEPYTVTPDIGVDAWLRELPKPVGIVTGGGYSATFIERSASRLGFHVPSEVAILSNSDDEVCLFADPPISAIRQRGAEIGRLALGILDATFGGAPLPQGRITIRSEGVIERASTGFAAGMPEELKRAVRYIREHACEGMDVADVLRHVSGLSRTRLYDTFPAYFGCSPAAEIVRVRLDEARRLLIQTELSVGRIAERCGFSSHSQFSDAFRRHFELTPLAWRKEQAMRKTK